jgi:hypothetical protein
VADSSRNLVGGITRLRVANEVDKPLLASKRETGTGWEGRSSEAFPLARGRGKVALGWEDSVQLPTTSHNPSSKNVIALCDATIAQLLCADLQIHSSRMEPNSLVFFTLACLLNGRSPLVCVASFQFVQVLQPRQNDLFARLLNLASEEYFVQYGVYLDRSVSMQSWT